MQFSINNSSPNFKGIRETRNIIKQLSRNNTYSLTENNERRISAAIDEISEHSGESNTRFLIKTANELKYSTNISLNKESKINWREKLHNAAEKSFINSDEQTQKKLAPSLADMRASKELSGTEKFILKTRESILSNLDMKQLENEKNPNIKNVKSNLDYFIESSETSIKEKAYILKRLNHMLSPNYEINPQLKNKKTKVFAEIINDLVINTPESKIPNTKAINQKQHGMCGGISIARKLMSYEEKSKYVDVLMSELDSSPNVMVFDKISLGEGKRIPVQKVYVDFDEAEKKGYRIIDASTTQWMNISDMYGASNTSKYVYTPFDGMNFDAMTSQRRMLLIDDDNYKYKHSTYQALLNAKDAIHSAKASELSKGLKVKNSKDLASQKVSYLMKLQNAMQDELKMVLPTAEPNELRSFGKEFLNLRQDFSQGLEKQKKELQPFLYIPNEEKEVKNKKIANFIKSRYPQADSKLVDEKSDSIREFIDESIALNKDIQPKLPQSRVVNQARKLYRAAAAYNYQKITALQDREYLIGKMVQYNIPDDETILSKNLAYIINKPDSNVSKVIVGRMGSEDILRQTKESLDYSLTKGLDSVYGALGFGNRRMALQNEINQKLEKIANNDLPDMEILAKSLGVKNNKNNIIASLEKHKNRLANPESTEMEYIDTFNKLGHKSQMEYVVSLFTQVGESLTKGDENSQMYVSYFNSLNGIPEGAPLTDTISRLNEIGNAINSFSEYHANLTNMLHVETVDGKVLNSVNPKQIIEKVMLKNGELYSDNELQPLKDHFDKMDKIRSQDEFSSRQGKISDKSLYRLSENEKNTVNKIRKNLNRMASETHKEIESTLKVIREPLEEHVRKIGVDTGHYWNSQISDGLFNGQELKILEQLTDRHYKETDNIKKAVEKIKNSPHSGISGSSVFHDRIGMHAQYIEEVTPSPKNGKDILYHDNTWGASELENTWVDSEGLIRTDYSDHRGGELGYVTNKKYLNGNYVDNLVYKTGETTASHVENKQLRKLQPDSSSTKFQLMRDILLPGEDGRAKSIAAEIKEDVFTPEYKQIGSFERVLSNMTTAEIEAGIMRNKLAANGYRHNVKTFKNKIFGNDFQKGIETEEAYNKLADDDIVKLTFEKAALSMSFPKGVEWKTLAKAKNIEELKPLKAKRDKNARSYFDYSFGKDYNVINSYLQDKSQNKSVEIITDSLKKNGIKLDDETIELIPIQAMRDFKKFDGSMKNTINMVVANVMAELDKVVPASEKLENAKKEIGRSLRVNLEDSLYINSKDVENNSTKFSGIKKYIDRKYNSETNKDLVKEYRRLQDMTTKEFKEETKDILPEELGIENLSGYELLKRYKGSNETVENKVHNLIYQKELLNDITLTDTRPSYKYHKLYKTEQGAFYKTGRTFDDLYRTFTFNLQNLELQPMFNAVKGDALKKYDMMPAYPKIQVLTKKSILDEREVFEESLNSSLEGIETNRNILRGYRITDKILGIADRFKDDKIPPKKEIHKIKSFAEEFIAENEGDTSITKSLESAQAILDLDKKAKGIEYKNALNSLRLEFDGYKVVNSPEAVEAGISASIKVVKDLASYMIASDVQPKKIQVVKDAYNNFIRKTMKSNAHFIDSKIDSMSESIDKYSLGKRGFKTVKGDYMETLESDLYNLTAVNNSWYANEYERLNNIDKAEEYVSTSSILEESKSQILAKIKKDTEIFIQGNIKPEYRDSVRKNSDALISLANKPNFENQEEMEKAREDFFKIFERYHILSKPQDLLESYMKLCAKDAAPESDKLKALMQHEKSVKKNYLTASSSAGTLVELQSSLMDIDNGVSPKLVVEKLFSYDSNLADPKTMLRLPMSDPKSINYLVDNMKINGNDETAIMFINKLGFAKPYIDAQLEIIDFVEGKKVVDGIVNHVGKTQTQVNIVNDALKPLLTGEITDSKEYLKAFDIAKKTILEKSKNFEDKAVIKQYLTALNSAKKVMKSNPEIPKNILLHQCLEQMNGGVQANLQSTVSTLQNELNYLHNTNKFVNKLDIPEYSDAYKVKQEFNKKYDEFLEYNNNSLINMSNENQNVTCIQE